MTEITTPNHDIRGYLHQLDETLKTVLLGLSGNVGEVKTVLAQNNETSKESNKNVYAVAVKIRDEQKSKFDELKSDIIRTADDVIQESKTYTDTRENGIISAVEETYLAKSDFGAYENETSSTLTILNDNITATSKTIEDLNTEYQEYKTEAGSAIALMPNSIISQVAESFISKNELDGESLEEFVSSKATQTASGVTEEFQKKIDAVSDEIAQINDGISSYIDDTTAYIRRGELENDVYGIEIGRSDSNIKTRFLNDRISFYQGEIEVAYISDNNLYITRAEVLDYMRIGNSNDGHFVFDVSQNGLELRWNE